MKNKDIVETIKGIFMILIGIGFYVCLFLWSKSCKESKGYKHHNDPVIIQRKQLSPKQEDLLDLLIEGYLDYDDLTPEQQELIDDYSDYDALRDEYDEYMKETGKNIDYQEYLQE